ncbi:Alpha-(1,3)-fucosyltransferase C [Habropoda laboriosa]|uniref:Fucosyltransferase n=1 Tax=Habropoda laboriosa TaxID=597456 RepID=A0A0L7RBK3_9HYME|nr:Alpha-(1,3)-fucosyltransferase C [Habropoda laboriosa]
MKLWISVKICLFILFTFTFTLYILSFYFNYRIYDILQFRRIIAGDLRVTNFTKKILFWNTMFGDETFYMGTGDIFQHCPVNDCYATHDRYYTDMEDFDAVLFHGNELEASDLPSIRSPRQWYVFVNLESPANRPLTSHIYEDFFNLTMTYRLDSDVVWTYGVVKDAHTGEVVAPSKNVDWSAYNRSGERSGILEKDAALSKTIRGKTKPIVWFVSNCVAKSGRESYVNRLSRYIPVDIYGKCGNMSCPQTKDCFREVVEPRYFFYLSFENSLCVDYATEKLYNALRYNVVPIVFGGANYNRFAPPGSYIHVLDYETPKHLAEYLKRLMKNPGAYIYRWRENT